MPHPWFGHFYIVSILASAFWLIQFLSNGDLLLEICRAQTAHAPSMQMTQIILVWALLLCQGLRRCWECYAVLRPSASQMWFGHYILGVAFYLMTSLAVWIEGASTISSHVYGNSSLVEVMSISPPSSGTLIGLPLFLLASGIQHDCHAYLAALPKYSLPEHPIFNVLVCPHYTSECMIYLALAIIAAPPGNFFNGSLLCTLTFVLVNLSVTARNTRQWYLKKFPLQKQQVLQRWIMLPGIW